MRYIMQHLKEGLSQWSQNTQPYARTSFEFSHFPAPQSLRLRNKSCTYEADGINARNMWKREGHEENPGTHEVMEKSWTEIFLKTTRLFENLEVTRKYIYDVKSKSEEVPPLHKQESHHWAPLTRLWEESELICKSAFYLQHKWPRCFNSTKRLTFS